MKIIFIIASVLISISCTSLNKGSSPLRSVSSTENDSRPLVSESALNIITAVQSVEEILVSEPKHASRFRLHQNDRGQSIKTKKVALIIHGLYLSPDWMTDQETLAFSMGYNVLNIRLKNHFEKNRTALDRALAEQWMIQVRAALDLALDLGDEVTIIGHSAGGLLAGLLLTERAESIQNLILLGPSFQMKASITHQVYLSTTLGVSGWTEEMFTKPPPSERYVSSWAGWQTILLSEQLAERGEKSPFVGSFSLFIEKLQGKKLLIIDTAVDQTIDLQVNRRIIEISLRMYGQNFIQHHIVDGRFNMVHRDMSRRIPARGYQEVIEPILRDALANQ